MNCEECGVELVNIPGIGTFCPCCTPLEDERPPRAERCRCRCRCKCGYSCDRKCGLDIIECIKAHYVRDCGHKWDGPGESNEMCSTATCSRCGMWAIDHDMQVGP